MDSAAVFELLLQSLQIFEEVIDRPRPGKQYPGIRYDKVRAGGRCCPEPYGITENFK